MRLAALRERVLVLLVLWALAPAAEARADWLLTPFIGMTFGAETAFLQLAPRAASSKHPIYGGSAAWLSDNVFGIEAEVAFAPDFFEGDDPLDLVLGSHVTTVFGSVVAAVPVSVTRESLRPYLVGGLGLVSARIEDYLRLAGNDESLGLQLGGGALGFLSNHIGLRFDLRYVRTLRRDTTVRAERQTKLSFWRATVGVVIRQ